MSLVLVKSSTHLIATLPSTWPAMSAASTAAMWIYCTAATGVTTQQSFFAVCGISGTSEQAGLHFGVKSGAAACWAYSSSSNIVTTATTLTSGTWNHIAFTFDGTTNIAYLNGVASGTTSTTTHPTSTPTTLQINGNYNTSTYATDGSVDDFRFYSRALSAAEIQSIYTLGGMHDDDVNAQLCHFSFYGPIGTSAVGARCFITNTALTALGSGTLTYGVSLMANARMSSC